MSTRIKSAAVAIVIAVILLIAHGTFLFNIAVGAISALAIYEIFRATKMTEHKYQTIAVRLPLWTLSCLCSTDTAGCTFSATSFTWGFSL